MMAIKYFPPFYLKFSAAKVTYGTSLANVDFLHGTAESLLTFTNLFIVLGLRKAIKEAESKAAEGAIGEVSEASAEEGGIRSTPK